MKKRYYGFRFYFGRETQYASTGKIAGELAVFSSKSELQTWLKDEQIGNSCGAGFGERIAVTKAQAVKLIGLNAFRQEVEDFEFELC